tara:strand:+ start:254 stop:535 length:282 start_codon:yes stop_codon:yes gene_type:complete
MTNYLTPAQEATTSHMLTLLPGEKFGDFWVREAAFHAQQENWVVFSSYGTQKETRIKLIDSQAKHALKKMNKWAAQSYVKSHTVRLESISITK